MEQELLSLIKSNKIFSSLDESACKQILPKFVRVELPTDGILFYQGDPSDSVFLLVSGKLIASLTTATGHNKTIGYIDPGETVGESGALTSGIRSLTIRATHDCILYKLSSRDFIEICHQHPAVMFATIHPIITRSSHLIEMLSPKKTGVHVVILPANKDISLALFAEKLLSYAEHFPNIIMLSDYHIEDNVNPTALQERIITLEKNKKPGHKILYLLKSHDTPLAKISLKKVDILYITAYSNSSPKIDTFILDKLKSNRTHLKSEPGLILLHPESTIMPRHTGHWLSQIKFLMHHHVRLHVAKDYHRLLRFVRGKAVGLVLGGGGTRGWAHLGVLKALHEEKIPIDMIGGTSVGALIAGCYAIHESYEDAYERFFRIVYDSRYAVSWRSFTWPAISLFNAKGFTTSQQAVFGNTQIEDLWVPYFCISCNLTENSEEVHRSGTLWEKTRASASIPGLIPPMIINNEIHLDGGLLNNLPIDVMREFLGNKAKIISVELNNVSNDHHKYIFPPILTFSQTLIAKLGFGPERYKFPSFIETFMRGLFIGSLAKAKQNTLGANIAINLNLSKFKMLHFGSKKAEKLIDIGYEETMKQIKSKELT